MGMIVILLGMMLDVIWCIESLWGTLQDLPLSYAPMMPVLLPWTMTLQSWYSSLVRISMAISRVMDSAQLISLPLALHPGVRDHAYHIFPKMMLMPQLDEASTHM